MVVQPCSIHCRPISREWLRPTLATWGADSYPLNKLVVWKIHYVLSNVDGKWYFDFFSWRTLIPFDLQMPQIGTWYVHVGWSAICPRYVYMACPNSNSQARKVSRLHTERSWAGCRGKASSGKIGVGCDFWKGYTLHQGTQNHHLHWSPLPGYTGSPCSLFYSHTHASAHYQVYA